MEIVVDFVLHTQKKDIKRIGGSTDISYIGFEKHERIPLSHRQQRKQHTQHHMEFQAIQYHEHCPAVVCMSWLDLTNQATGPHTRQLVETSIFLANRAQVSHKGDYIQTGFRHINFHQECATKHFHQSFIYSPTEALVSCLK